MFTSMMLLWNPASLLADHPLDLPPVEERSGETTTEHQERQQLRLRIIGFGFTLLVEEHPVLAGPYPDWDTCEKVREFQERRGYETDRCQLMAMPLEGAQELHVGELPK